MNERPRDTPDDLLLLYGSRPERKSPLLVQIALSLPIIGILRGLSKGGRVGPN